MNFNIVFKCKFFFWRDAKARTTGKDGEWLRVVRPANWRDVYSENVVYQGHAYAVQRVQ